MGRCVCMWWLRHYQEAYRSSHNRDRHLLLLQQATAAGVKQDEAINWMEKKVSRDGIQAASASPHRPTAPVDCWLLTPRDRPNADTGQPKLHYQHHCHLPKTGGRSPHAGVGRGGAAGYHGASVRALHRLPRCVLWGGAVGMVPCPMGSCRWHDDRSTYTHIHARSTGGSINSHAPIHVILVRPTDPSHQHTMT